MSRLAFALALAAVLVGCGSSGDDATTVKPTPEQMAGGNVNKSPQARERFRNGGGSAGRGGGMQSGLGAR